MKRPYKIILTVAALSLAASLAYAHGRHGRHGGPGWFQSHASEKVDDALDAANASAAQRTAIHASLQHVFDSFADGRKAGGEAINEAMQLFQADKIDPAAVARHRAAKEAEVKRIGGAVVQFVHDAHDALTAAQRQQVIAFVRAEKSELGHEHGFKERMMGAVIQARVDTVLDEIKATAAQRATVNAAKDRVIDAFKNGHADHGAVFEQLVTIFAADKIDNAKVDALRAEHMQRMNKIADAVVQSITEVHDALDPTQRAAIVGLVKAHHDHDHEHGPHHRG